MTVSEFPWLPDPAFLYPTPTRTRLPTLGNPALWEILKQEIAASPQQRLTFAEYMDCVLYHPQQGYYATHIQLGTQGDFVTAPHVTADFGELLAVQFVTLWQSLGQPDRFTLVEMGAGEGVLARDILRALHQQAPACFAALDYCIVEVSAYLRNRQHRTLQSLGSLADRVRWQCLEDLPEQGVTGCFFANELVDAFPVHRVMVENGQLQEIYVTIAPDSKDGEPQLQEVIGDLSTPALRTYFDRLGINLLSGQYPNGYRTEVSLAALDWLAKVASRLQRGYVLTIDYGYPAARYYNPRRPQGTLQCYYQQRHHDDPYVYLGHQDLTAHVDFTTLQIWGEAQGLTTIGLTQQGPYLMALGLGERLRTIANNPSYLTGHDLQTLLSRRQALHDLINPLGMGSFGVLLQAKGMGSTTTPVWPLRDLDRKPNC
ncbi:class I SAM-dependent methyltransferase [Trichothermofontia sp.]